MQIVSRISIIVMAVFLCGFACAEKKSAIDEAAFAQAKTNAASANEGFRRCRAYLYGWLAHTDSASGLIPRNLEADTDIWNAQDSAADNYPFMVLTAAILDRDLFAGCMRAMLEAEKQLTSRLGPLPDTYSFSKRDFRDAAPDLGRIIFGSSEYVKDGLMPLTEWLGPSPWSERMIEILDALWEKAPVETPFGRIISDSHEINGEMLQTLSRVYWMTGEEKYLDWAVRLGDYYLLGNHHPTRDTDRLRLRDHGCEIVSGLCELYATVDFARPEKQEEYRIPLHQMLDRILETGLTTDGLFYNEIDPKSGVVIQDGLADTWGYTFNGYYTVWLIDGVEQYREAVLNGLTSIGTGYRSYDWENGSADGYADAIESALTLYNREPLIPVAAWIDSEIRVMWAKQRPDGIIEGWHGDGNFARTTIMYCLWKTQGVTINPWREDIRFGALATDDSLLVVASADSNWTGKLVFDTPRHERYMKLPLDWPRINQFPEWFTADGEKSYTLTDILSDEESVITGKEMIDGVMITIGAGTEKRLIVAELHDR